MGGVSAKLRPFEKVGWGVTPRRDSPPLRGGSGGDFWNAEGGVTFSEFSLTPRLRAGSTGGSELSLEIRERHIKNTV